MGGCESSCHAAPGRCHGAMGLLSALSSPRYIRPWPRAAGIPLALPACALNRSQMPGWAPLATAVLWAGERG